MRWTEGLLQEVARVTELKDSGRDPAEGSRLLGELPEDVKKLYTYADMLFDKIAGLKKEAEVTDSRQAARELHKIIDRLSCRKSIAAAIMWEEIKFHFQDKIEQVGSSLSICKGFQIYQDPPGSGMPTFLRGLCGRGCE